MGSAKREECIEQSCTAWGVIAFTASDEPRMGGNGLPVEEIISEPVYGCRDVE